MITGCQWFEIWGYLNGILFKKQLMSFAAHLIPKQPPPH